MTSNCIWGSEIAFLVMKHKNFVTLPVSFTGSYTEDEPTSPWQKNLIFRSFVGHHRVLKSGRLPPKITTYLVSMGRPLCLAFLYGCRFLNKISLDWSLTLTTQPSTWKLSDNPDVNKVVNFKNFSRLLSEYWDWIPKDNHSGLVLKRHHILKVISIVMYDQVWRWKLHCLI